MKIIFLVLALASASAFAQGRSSNENKSGWALLYGRNSLNDGQKQAEDLDPTGNSFKGLFTQREKFWDYGFMIRSSNATDDFTFQSTKGKFTQRDYSLGVQAGFWAFSWLQAHVGYAAHGLHERVSGNFTANQKDTLKDTFGLNNTTVPGIYAGGELVLIQKDGFQFFVNYDYYHLNSLQAHTWEGMAGVRLYFKQANVGKGNWFVKLFEGILKPKE